MIYKVIGAAFVILSTTALGFSKVSEYKNRVKYLDSMKSCVVQLENEIRYTQTPLSVAFKKISQGAHELINDIFIKASTRANDASGDTMSVIWQDAVEDISHQISDDDRALFISLGECLGGSDVDGQIKSIGLFSSKVSEALKQAEKQSENNQKLYKNLGIYSGILIAILFL